MGRVADLENEVKALKKQVEESGGALVEQRLAAAREELDAARAELKAERERKAEEPPKPEGAKPFDLAAFLFNW